MTQSRNLESKFVSFRFPEEESEEEDEDGDDDGRTDEDDEDCEEDEGMTTLVCGHCETAKH